MAPKIDYSLRFPDGEYFPAARKKTGIAIHHTVGGTAGSTFAWWLKDRTRAGNRRVVGTAYIIDRDGTVYQVFEPTAWAFQFGLKWPPARQMKFEQRFIGIEIASEGGLTEFDGDLYCFDEAGLRPLHERMARTIPKLRGYTDAFGHLLVLSGAAEAMVDCDLNPWDAAVTRVLAREAGGVCWVREREGGQKLDLVFGNEAIVQAIGKLF